MTALIMSDLRVEQVFITRANKTVELSKVILKYFLNFVSLKRWNDEYE